MKRGPKPKPQEETRIKGMLFCAVMYFQKNVKNHSYVLGVYRSLFRATRAAFEESHRRNMEYSGWIMVVNCDQDYHDSQFTPYWPGFWAEKADLVED